MSGKQWKSLNMISPLFSYDNIIHCNINSIITGLWMVWYITDFLWAQENLVEAFIWTLFLQAWWKFLGIYWSSTTVTGYLNLVSEIHNSYIRKLNLLLTNILPLAVHKKRNRFNLDISTALLLLLLLFCLFLPKYNLFKDSWFLQEFSSRFMIRIQIVISVSISHKLIKSKALLSSVTLIWESFDAFFLEKIFLFRGCTRHQRTGMNNRSQLNYRKKPTLRTWFVRKFAR